MANSVQKEVVGWVKGGYSPIQNSERGYKPSGQVPKDPQPPNVGSAAVKPLGKPDSNLTSASVEGQGKS